MGYWAKDGSYVREDTDVTPLSQAQLWEAQDRGKEIDKRLEEEAKRKREAEAEERAEMQAVDRAIAEARQKEMEEQFKRERDMQYKQDPTLWLKKPRDLAERRARANYWRLNSKFGLLMSKINGKDKKFDNLWNKFSHASTEEEKLAIVEEMERMYPTTKGRIARAEKKEGRSR